MYLNHIGKNTLTRIHYVVGEIQVLKLIMKLKITELSEKTKKLCKKMPTCNGYNVDSELDNVLKIGGYEFSLGYDNVDWFVDEISTLENKMCFYLKEQ